MTVQEELWCELFIKTGSIVEATEKAGYVTYYEEMDDDYFYNRGKEIYRRPHIQEHIQNLYKDEALTPNKLIALLSKHATANMGDYISIDSNGRVSLDLRKAEQRGTLSNIKKLTIRETQYGQQVNVELYPADMAVKTLCQYYDMFSTKMPIDYANQLWVYFTKGLIDLQFLYQELGVEGAHQLLDTIPLPEEADVIDL